MKNTTCRIPRPLGLLLLLPSLASADFYQAPFGPGGTWNIYETVPTGGTFKAALADAQSRTAGGVPGTLVSITSADENAFLSRHIRKGTDTWIGLTDREGAAPGAQESQTFGSPGNLTSGWAWTSGEAFTYQNWGGGEPNDAGGEDATQMRGDGMWNDNASGFGNNDPIAPVLQPGGSSNAEGAAAFGYVVEYFTGSATPVAGVRLGSIFPAGPTSAPRGQVGTWGVREVRGLPGAANIFDAALKLESGGGTSTTGQLARLNVSDPDGNALGGPILAGPTTPFLSNTAGDDNDILTIANGRIKVTEAGTYTLQVRSDDGFALQVKGQQFDSVNGLGYIDPADRSTIAFGDGTGDANTRGVITLAAGEYDVNFIHFEGGGGANYEVTSTKGAVTDPTKAQWLALGDGSTQAARPVDVVRMTSAATVTNARAADPNPNNLTSAKAQLSAAIAGGTSVSGPFSTLDIPEGSMPIAATIDPDDNYVTQVTGGVAVNNLNGISGESIQITFHIAADDGASLQFDGANFTKATDFTGDGDAKLEGGALVADYPTGNTNAFGLIELQEGKNYNFTAFHTEGGGGSSLAIWYALGDFTTLGFDSASFRRLTSDDTGFFTANTGMALVPEPSTTGLFGLAAFGLLGVRRRRAAN